MADHTRRDFIHRSLSGGVALLVGCHSDELFPGGVADALDGVGELPGDTTSDTASPDAGQDALADTAADGSDDAQDAARETVEDVAGELVEDTGPPPVVCEDPFAKGTLVALVPFFDENPPPFGVKLGQGWDGRLYHELSALEPDDSITPVDQFYLRTFYPDLLDPDAPWSLTIDGLVQTQLTLTMEELLPLVEPQGVHLLECSGNGVGGGFGLMSACEWAGVPLSALFDQVAPLPSATQVLVTGFDEHSVPSAGGHSTPGASWVFTLQQLADAGAFLATHMNGEPLQDDRGAPARLFVPRWYGCSCIKWLETITFVDESAPATSQMKEFAGRTHQNGVPALAKDYAPASQEVSATPVRVERWTVDGETVYRVLGILWGGQEPVDGLQIRFGRGGPWEDVDLCPPHEDNATWSLWSHAWRPVVPGMHEVALRVADPTVPQRRLTNGWYRRQVLV